MAANMPKNNELILKFAQGLFAQDGFDAICWHIVSRIKLIAPADRSLLLRVTPKFNLITSDAAIEDVATSDYLESIKPLIKKADTGVTHWAANSQQNVFSQKISASNAGTSVLTIKITTRDGSCWCLWLERWQAKEWETSDIQSMEQVLPFVTEALTKKAQKNKFRKRSIIAMAVALIALLPVRDNVSGEVEITSERSQAIFAPMDGVIKKSFIQGGDRVSKERQILKFDDALIVRWLEEAKSDLQVSVAELQRLESASYSSAEARAQLSVQRLVVDKNKLKVTHLQDQLLKTTVISPFSGVAVYADSNKDIEGSYVRIGEQILEVADDTVLGFKAMVPVADAGSVRVGDEVQIRLSGAPFHSYEAAVEQIGVAVVMSNEDVPSLLVKGKVDKSELLIPGLRGVVVVRGSWTVLGMRLLKKPFAYLSKLFSF